MISTVCRRLALGLAPLAFATTTVPARAAPSDLRIRVDQFGYRPNARKVAVLRSPVTGYDAPIAFTPGPMIDVRRISDGSVAFSAPPVAWNGGATHAQSGDRAWWFEFTALTETGAFIVVDPSSGVASEPFDIGDGVYDAVLRHAVRMYFYQRCGVSKAAPFAHPNWADAVCHLGPQQDLDCRAVQNPVPSTSRNLSGGWHDAGDYNKYVNYADQAVHSLLSAFEAAPHVWGDDAGIPESGNGLPDLLDELKWELDWLLRMQIADGSVPHKMAVTDFSAASPPSVDGGFRRYAPPTASATISAAGAFAHGALVYSGVAHPIAQAYAAQLRAAAESAWAWLAANPGAIPSNYSNAGFVNAAAEDAPYDQSLKRIVAASYLWRLTGLTTYRAYFDANYTTAHLFQWTWASPYELAYHDAYLAYADAPGATADVASAIRSTYRASVSGPAHYGNVASAADPYRAHLNTGDYTWGSNRTKASQGLLYVLMGRYCLDPPGAAAYRAAAEDFLHYLHGVNPPGLAYLTNMLQAGAEGSINETYHAWFAHGTVWDSAATSPFGPPPGYLSGGPNPSYQPDPSYGGPPLVPPLNQPAQKSYRDWNTGWPENSWEVTECHIPYQASYVRLLTAFVARGAGCSADLNADGRVNGQDVQGFVACLLGPGPRCGCADLNGGGVTPADIAGFVSLLLGAQACP